MLWMASPEEWRRLKKEISVLKGRAIEIQTTKTK